MKDSPIVICSPANTVTAAPTSVSFGVAAVELSEALFVAPVVDTVTALPTIAFTQVLAKVRPAAIRVFVSVQTIATGVEPMVSWLPTRVVPPERPLQVRPEA